MMVVFAPTVLLLALVIPAAILGRFFIRLSPWYRAKRREVAALESMNVSLEQMSGRRKYERKKHSNRRRAA